MIPRQEIISISCTIFWIGLPLSAPTILGINASDLPRASPVRPISVAALRRAVLFSPMIWFSPPDSRDLMPSPRMILPMSPLDILLANTAALLYILSPSCL